ncbi:MAG: hypothetical protein LBU32_08270 [Clostridiales bacterium]|jgi:hypothetical protein|nr:hypothetical protein [Clostridiales bacterium]
MKHRKTTRTAILTSVALIIAVALAACALDAGNGDGQIGGTAYPIDWNGETQRSYYLEDAPDDTLMATRVMSITLYADGKIEIPEPIFSSYMFLPSHYVIDGYDILVYEDGNADDYSVRFKMTSAEAIEFAENNLGFGVYMDVGARYVYAASAGTPLLGTPALEIGIIPDNLDVSQTVLDKAVERAKNECGTGTVGLEGQRELGEEFDNWKLAKLEKVYGAAAENLASYCFEAIAAREVVLPVPGCGECYTVFADAVLRKLESADTCDRLCIGRALFLFPAFNNIPDKCAKFVRLRLRDFVREHCRSIEYIASLNRHIAVNCDNTPSVGICVQKPVVRVKFLGASGGDGRFEVLNKDTEPRMGFKEGLQYRSRRLFHGGMPEAPIQRLQLGGAEVDSRGS